MAELPPKQVFDYLRPILEHETTAAQDIWEKSGHGGYAFRFDVDLTGDGMPEMFIGSSLWSRKSAVTWQAYKGLPNGEYRAFSYQSKREGLRLSASELLLDETGAAKSILTFDFDRGKYYVGRYSFRDAEIVCERSEVTEAKFAELKAGPNIKRVAPEVRGVLLADLLRNPNAEWKPLDFKSAAPSPEGYCIAPDDAERVKGLVNLTPDLALRWLASAAEGKTPSDASPVSIPRPPPAPRQSPDASPTASPKPSSPAFVVAESPAPLVERGAPVWPWLVGLLVLMAIVAAALKRRA